MARPVFLWRHRWNVVFAVGAAWLLAGCGTTHRLPPYEPPLARTELQTVRTTAYTHTEADHLAYGNHNALGGILHAAPPPVRPAAAAGAIPLAASLAGTVLSVWLSRR